MRLFMLFFCLLLIKPLLVGLIKTDVHEYYSSAQPVELRTSSQSKQWAGTGVRRWDAVLYAASIKDVYLKGDKHCTWPNKIHDYM